MSFLLFILINLSAVNSRSLWEVVCAHHKCSTNDDAVNDAVHIKRNPAKPASHFGSPSEEEFFRWQNYEKVEGGTGLHPDSGYGYGPGLGNVLINTGIGIQHPVGGLGITRDFGLYMGGSGRSGGRAFGWGNGYPFIVGAAPWANPIPGIV